MEWGLATVALALLAVAAVSKRLSGSPVTPAMLFVSIGLLIGPEFLDSIDIASTSSTVGGLAEATLALVLFSDASRIDLGTLKRDISLPVRLGTCNSGVGSSRRRSRVETAFGFAGHAGISWAAWPC